MKFIHFLLAAALLQASAARAQFGIGAEIGFNAAKYKVTSSTNPEDIKTWFGVRVGAVADVALSDNFYLQPGLYYVRNGYKNDFPGPYKEYEEIAFNTMEIPVNIVYKIGELGRSRFFVGAGGFVGYNRDGYYKLLKVVAIDSRSDLRIGGGAADQLKRYDAGVGLNVGYQLSQGLFVRARGQLGLVNLCPQGNADNVIRSFTYGFTVGYMFYRHDREGRLIVTRKNRRTPHPVADEKVK